MSDQLLDIGKDILNETIVNLKGQYERIPDSVKGIMPKAAGLIARSAISGGKLDASDDADLRHALAIMANVKVGAQVALNELMLQTAEKILARGFNFVRKIVGL